TASPETASASRGRMAARGRPDPYEDRGLRPGGAPSASPARRSPGVRPADPEEVVGKGVRTLVIGRGTGGASERLRARGIDARVPQSEPAAREYSAPAARGVRVGGVFHSARRGAARAPPLTCPGRVGEVDLSDEAVPSGARVAEVGGFGVDDLGPAVRVQDLRGRGEGR
uniref:Uncharacterized protein n=1 Tax=Ornithorhynchus anatinus TaxID=9258 RepID=A0A6I8P7V8_ORNAN